MSQTMGSGKPKIGNHICKSPYLIIRRLSLKTGHFIFQVVFT